LELDMTISRDDALKALHDMERAEARSLDARVYRTAGVQLVGWGVVWLIGYSLTGLRPAWASVIWPALVVAGCLFSFAVVRLRASKGGPVGWRWAVNSLSVVLFFGGTYSIFGVVSPAAAAAFPALVLAFVYAVVGGSRFTRFLLIGAAVFALTMVGFFYLRAVLDYWLAVVGGGALILGGAWLMRA
jgi:hypothetical protein